MYYEYILFYICLKIKENVYFSGRAKTWTAPTEVIKGAWPPAPLPTSSAHVCATNNI